MSAESAANLNFSALVNQIRDLKPFRAYFQIVDSVSPLLYLSAGQVFTLFLSKHFLELTSKEEIQTFIDRTLKQELP